MTSTSLGPASMSIAHLTHVHARENSSDRSIEAEPTHRSSTRTGKQHCSGGDQHTARGLSHTKCRQACRWHTREQNTGRKQQRSGGTNIPWVCPTPNMHYRAAPQTDRSSVSNPSGWMRQRRKQETSDLRHAPCKNVKIKAVVRAYKPRTTQHGSSHRHVLCSWGNKAHRTIFWERFYIDHH